MIQQELMQKAANKTVEYQPMIEKDPHRLQFHLVPPVGLLNDPNGLIQFKGVYHVFYQWNPFDTSHGAKFWGHFTSVDLVHWQEQPPALVPSEWYEKNGCYSGSAVEADGKLHLFYTGNVKDENGQRQTYQCMAVSTDGIHFEKKGPVIFLPEGYTAHFRDPKVWNHEGTWYMVLGAQTEDEDGHVVLYSSKNLTNWTFKGPLAGGNMNGLSDFGYMWECPDLFRLGQKDVLLISPQGLEAQGHHCQNLFQSGYFTGEWEPENNLFKHNGSFVELDRGFDFYAPQTFEDDKGRRILYAWMGITDENEEFQPTITHGWIHGLTIPREIELKGNRIVQKPVIEMKQLRKPDKFQEIAFIHDQEKICRNLGGTTSEIHIEIQKVQANQVEFSFHDNVKLRYCNDEQLFTLERKSFKEGAPETRSCEMKSLKNMHIFLDASSIEVFLNGGEEVMTARFFPDPDDTSFVISTDGKAELKIIQWNLATGKEMKS